MLLLTSVQCFAAQVLKETSFQDQFDNKLELNEKIEWLIFTKDKESSNIINNVFTELKVIDLEKYKVLYVADISQMPSFVTKLFALPKMKKYSYRIALGKEGVESKNFPSKKDMITILNLSKLSIVEEIFVNTEPDFKKVWEGID